MPTDDFVAGVTLDQGGTGVPVSDKTFRIKHVNRVITYTLNQSMEPLVTFRRRLYGIVALHGFVLVGEPSQFTVTQEATAYRLFMLRLGCRPKTRKPSCMSGPG